MGAFSKIWRTGVVGGVAFAQVYLTDVSLVLGSTYNGNEGPFLQKQAGSGSGVQPATKEAPLPGDGREQGGEGEEPAALLQLVNSLADIFNGKEDGSGKVQQLGSNIRRLLSEGEELVDGPGEEEEEEGADHRRLSEAEDQEEEADRRRLSEAEDQEEGANRAMSEAEDQEEGGNSEGQEEGSDRRRLSEAEDQEEEASRTIYEEEYQEEGGNSEGQEEEADRRRLSEAEDQEEGANRTMSLAEDQEEGDNSEGQEEEADRRRLSEAEDQEEGANRNMSEAEDQEEGGSSEGQEEGADRRRLSEAEDQEEGGSSESQEEGADRRRLSEAEDQEEEGNNSEEEEGTNRRRLRAESEAQASSGNLADLLRSAYGSMESRLGGAVGVKGSAGVSGQVALRPPSVVGLDQAMQRARRAASILGDAINYFISSVTDLFEKGAEVPLAGAAELADNVMVKVTEGGEKARDATAEMSGALKAAFEGWASSFMEQLQKTKPELLAQAGAIQKKLESIQEEISELGRKLMEQATVAYGKTEESGGASSSAAEKPSPDGEGSDLDAFN